MLRFVPHHRKTKNDGGTLMLCPDCYKDKACAIKLLIIMLHALEFVPACYKTQKMRNKVVNTYPSAM